MSYQSTCILFPLIPWLLCHAQILCRTRRCNSMLGRSTPLLRQKLSTTSFLTLAAAALSKSAVLKWMRPKDCQKQQKAISSLYLFSNIFSCQQQQKSFSCPWKSHDHQFLFISDRVVRSCKSSDSFSVWAIRCYCGCWWLQKCGPCRSLNRLTGKTQMLHVGSCLEHYLVVIIRRNCA